MRHFLVRQDSQESIIHHRSNRMRIQNQQVECIIQVRRIQDDRGGKPDNGRDVGIVEEEDKEKTMDSVYGKGLIVSG
jgi:hypothetical protein